MVMRDPLLTSSAVKNTRQSIFKLSSIETRHIVHVHQIRNFGVIKYKSENLLHM